MDARKKLQKMVGYNGYYGCFYCTTPGIYVEQKKHIYFPNDSASLRDSSLIPQNIQKVGNFVLV